MKSSGWKTNPVSIREMQYFRTQGIFSVVKIQLIRNLLQKIWESQNAQALTSSDDKCTAAVLVAQEMYHSSLASLVHGHLQNMYIPHLESQDKLHITCIVGIFALYIKISNI